MERQQEGDRWHLVGPNRKYPMPGKLVQVVVDGDVMAGEYNERRSLWFIGDRPIYPTHWRPMSRPPRSLR